MSADIRPPAGGADHHHDFLGAAHDRNARRTTWVVAITALTMIVEIAAGHVTGSMALLADGVHMATHAGALGVAAIAYGYARRHVADPRYSFGTGKVGDLAGFASALGLGLIALGIAVESAVRLAEPARIAFGEATVVAVAGLAVNLVSALLLSDGHAHRHQHHHHDHHHHDDGHHHHHHGHDNNLRAAYLHVLADALTSLLAIAALLAGRYLGWAWLDPAMGLVGAAVVARWSWSLMRDSAAVLLDTADPVLAAEIRDRIEAPGDAVVVDLHVWRIGPAAHAAIVRIAGKTAPAAIRERLRPVHAVGHLTIEV